MMLCILLTVDRRVMLTAPEVFLRKEYGTAVDWWALGIVVYEMLTGLPPWYSQNPHTMRRRILKKPLAFPSFVSQNARDLVRGLLRCDPLQRLGSRGGSAEVKHHEFFRSVDWQLMTFREVLAPLQPCTSPDSIVRRLLERTPASLLAN